MCHRLLLHQENRAADLAAWTQERRAGHPARDPLAATIDRARHELGEATTLAERAADAGAQIFERQADVEIQEILTCHFVGAQSPQILSAVIPRDHVQLAIDDDDARTNAGEDRLEEAVRAV